jgi:hypothetical protein
MSKSWIVLCFWPFWERKEKYLFPAQSAGYDGARIPSGGMPMIFRIQITLSEAEAAGLAQLSTRDIRSPRDQVRFLIRRELIQSGYIDPLLGSGTARDVIPPQP